MRLALTAIVALILAACSAAAAEPDSTIKIDAGKVLNRITPLMYGSCIEDVNHEIYGGLYAQMIFGESFEEPPFTLGSNWIRYGGEWSVRDGICSVKADGGAKILWNDSTSSDVTIECDIRLDDDKGENAGLIVRMNQSHIGADAFNGYEVSISARRSYLRVGRHRNNWEPIKEVAATVRAREWHHLKVELLGQDLRIFLDGSKSPTLAYHDEDPIKWGSVGLRTWQSNASFRRLFVTDEKGSRHAEFASSDSPNGVSGMWDPIATGAPASFPEASSKEAHSSDKAAAQSPPATGRYTWDSTNAYNTAHSQRIEFVRGEGAVGIANSGLNRWGLSVDGGYEGYLYLRQDRYDGAVTVALQSADGKRTYAQQRLESITKEWRAHKFTLRAHERDKKARFAIWIDRPGTIWVDQVYLSPTREGRFHDLPIRGDIARALQDEGLTVLRYGGSMVNADGYRWKNMIGNPDKRPQYKGWWYPYSTNGFGIEEFLQFCEAAKFEKVFAINIEETPQDTADLVEYLNGPATSKWGAERAKNGHPAPYGVKYIEIGNEEKTAPHYIERFKLLYDAMHAKDPRVQFIIAAWWEPDNPVSKRIVQELDGKAALWDVHVGGDDLHEGRNVDAVFTRMEKLVHEWAPKTTLKACVLEENGGRHDMQRALGHACILNATQRHGDFVLIDCPANCLQPWQQNDNDWDQGQLFFTSDHVVPMPPFFAQQMAAANHLPCRVVSVVESPGDELDLIAARSDDGSTLVTRVVNIGKKPHRSRLVLNEFGPVAPRAEEFSLSVSPHAEEFSLSGGLDAVSDPLFGDWETPSFHTNRRAIDHAGERFDYEFPAYSYTILKLKRK